MAQEDVKARVILVQIQRSLCPTMLSLRTLNTKCFTDSEKEGAGPTED